jgi:predicted nucleic acid-binding protein
MSSHRFVIDANIALYAFSPDPALDPAMLPSAEAARAFLARAVTENAALFVPWLFFSEVVNTVTRSVGAGKLTPDEGEQMLEDIMQVPWTPLLPKWREVFHITRSLNRFKAGDSEFVAVALDTGASLITADQALLSTVQNMKLPYPVQDVLTHAWAKI